MFFTVENNQYIPAEHLRTNTLLNAYYVIKKYPLNASELLLNQYIQQRYNTTLKNMSIKLLLNLSFYKDTTGNFILMFKDQNMDAIARLITYGNGIIPGSRILQLAINS